MGRLLLKFLLITVLCIEDAENTRCLSCPHLFLLDSLNITHTHIHTHSFHNESKGKVETGKAIGFKLEENNSELTLILIGEDLGGYGLQDVSESSQVFIANGE